MPLDDGRPIFQQVAREICRRIARGDLQSGEKLPTVREMAVAFRVNPNTIQRVCQELERQGAITSRRGHGIFVADAPAMLANLRQEMVQEAIDACLLELRALGLSEEAMVAEFRRRLAARTGTDGAAARTGGASDHTDGAPASTDGAAARIQHARVRTEATTPEGDPET